MAVKIGDKVRFLNATCGGTVVGFKSKEIALVRDADDFDIPTHVRDIVVVVETNQYNFPTEEPILQSEIKQTTHAVTPENNEKAATSEPASAAYTFDECDETPEGEQLSVYLAFVPTDIKRPETCDLEAYLINDSNYYLAFNLLLGNDSAELHIQNQIEPQTRLQLETIARTSLNDWPDIRFQALAFKRKTFAPKPPIDVTININPTRFYKLHSFVQNDFFDCAALIETIVENDVFDFDIQIDAHALQEAIMQKEQPVRKSVRKPAKPTTAPLEIDLHINALLDNTQGMERADMLRYQIDKFNQVMRENLHRRGRKIVFIHGKGEGVLRAAIEKELRSKYRSCYFQDASFQQYGFGATQVTIR